MTDRIASPSVPPVIGALRAILLTTGALVAFAANSVLCRLALGAMAIDPAAFTAIRLVSGAAALWLVTALLGRAIPIGRSGSWISAIMLFAYATAFSFAYVDLAAGTGALLLFGSVQATMIVAGLRTGERPHVLAWTGIAIALAGLIALVLPGMHAPPLAGALLMVAAGIAWGVYSLRGRAGSAPRTGTAMQPAVPAVASRRARPDPIATTADHFARTVPFVLALALLRAPALHVSPGGILLAAISGAVTSGLGYVIWYAALPSMTATRAAAVQLTVPVLAAVGGVLFLAETPTLRLLAAAILILGGVALTGVGRGRAIRSAVERATARSSEPRRSADPGRRR
jgi:drug/metabolite transporter (DMT)-like permease